MILSKRLAGPTNVAANATSTIATVPTGKVWSIKCVTVVNLSGTAGTAIVGVGGVGAGQAFLRPNPVAANNEKIYERLTVVLTAGETLQANAITSAMTFTVSGFEFDA